MLCRVKAFCYRFVICAAQKILQVFFVKSFKYFIKIQKVKSTFNVIILVESIDAIIVIIIQCLLNEKR
jgi:hypothetical protein